MNIKEIIDQIGGRERLAKLVSQYEEDGYCDVKDDEVIAAVIGLLALLDAQQKPFMYAISDCDGKAHFDECCVSAHGCDLEDVVGYLNDFREGVDDGYSIVPVYAVPPAASVPDGLAAAVNLLLDSDGSRGTFSAIRRGNALTEVERLLAAAPAPENK